MGFCEKFVGNVSEIIQEIEWIKRKIKSNLEKVERVR